MNKNKLICFISNTVVVARAVVATVVVGAALVVVSTDSVIVDSLLVVNVTELVAKMFWFSNKFFFLNSKCSKPYAVLWVKVWVVSSAVVVVVFAIVVVDTEELLVVVESGPGLASAPSFFHDNWI